MLKYDEISEGRFEFFTAVKFQVEVFWDVTQVTLKEEAARCSETSVSYISTRRHNPKDHSLSIYRRERPKYRMMSGYRHTVRLFSGR